jgi:phosphatidylglycerophosphate synthase
MPGTRTTCGPSTSGTNVCGAPPGTIATMRMDLVPPDPERATHRPLGVTIPKSVDLAASNPYRLGPVQESVPAGTASARPPVTVGRLHIQPLLATVAGAEAILLAVLSARVGLGPAGWLAGIAYGVGLWGLLTAATRRAGTRTLGPAGLVTSARAVLVGGMTALVTDRLWGGDVLTVPLVVMATVALILDAVDGPVARRTGTASALGARFDVEVDSVLVLVLSLYVAVLLGPWVFVIGAMRYAFVAAGWAAPWLRSPLPTSYSAKAVAALQGIVLVVAAADVLPRSLAAALAGVALALLVWSFTRSVIWLWCDAGRATRAGGAELPVDEPSQSLRPPTGRVSARALLAGRSPQWLLRDGGCARHVEAHQDVVAGEEHRPVDEPDAVGDPVDAHRPDCLDTRTDDGR